MSCKIFRDFDTDEIVQVQGPDGTNSKLYSDALKVLNDKEQALNIWAYAYTDQFKDRFSGDWQKGTGYTPISGLEPVYTEVVKALQESYDEKLNLKEATEVLSFMQSSGMDVDSLYTSLRGLLFNKDGVFSINKKKLLNSGLFTSEEVDNLLQFPSIRGNLQTSLNKLKNSLQEDTDVFKTGMVVSPPIKIYSGEINSFGKLVTLPSSEVDNYLLDNLNPYSSESNLKNEIESLENEDIREALLESPEALGYARSLVTNMKRVPVMTLKEGIVVQKDLNDVSQILQNTVNVNVDKVDYTAAVDSIRGIGEVDWVYNPETAISTLNQVKYEAALIGLDFTGIEDLYYSKDYEEILGFLDLVDDFNISTEDLSVTELDINDLADAISEFFNVEGKLSFEGVNVPANLRSKNLVKVEGKLNETFLYRTEGLIKVYGDIYQRVNSFGDYRLALESVYDVIQKDASILPEEAFKDLGGLSLNKITDPTFKEKVITSINNYVSKNVDLPFEDSQDIDTNKELTLMKMLFNPQQLPKIDVENNVAIRIQNFRGDANYLAKQFISDFYHRFLEEKVIKDSDLYNLALKYFNITDAGIVVDNISDDVVPQIKMVLQSEPILYENLVQYSYLSKNNSLEFLNENIMDELVETRDTRREFVINNPETLTKFTGETVEVGNSSLVTQNSTEEFIRTSDGIYEITNIQDGVSVYSKVELNLDPYFYTFGMSEPIIEEIDTIPYKNEIPSKVIEKATTISDKTIENKQEVMSCTV